MCQHPVVLSCLCVREQPCCGGLCVVGVWDEKEREDQFEVTDSDVLQQAGGLTVLWMQR
jgi:hypothetical protein